MFPEINRWKTQNHTQCVLSRIKRIGCAEFRALVLFTVYSSRRNALMRVFSRISIKIGWLLFVGACLFSHRWRVLINVRRALR